MNCARLLTHTWARNEPDIYSDDIRYTWEGSVEDFYQLMKVSYLAVKDANPDDDVNLRKAASLVP